MGVGSSLNIALSALTTNQRQLELTSNNIANAGSTGYSRRTLQTDAQVAGDRTYGVSAGKVERVINLQVQKLWRSAVGNSTYADTRSDILQRLDQMFGGPGDANSLDSAFNDFKSAMETLATSPENGAQRIQAAASANALASRIRGLSDSVQGLRQEAETGIGAAVTEANSLLKKISDLDKQIVSLGAGDNSTAGLEDERDTALDSLSKLMDIRVEDRQYGSIAVFTNNGTTLYDKEPVQFAFDEHGVVTPSNSFGVSESTRTIGTVTIASGPGAGRDAFRDGVFNSGKIAAYKELRDVSLVKAQSQLDELAAKIATAVGNNKVSGSTTTGGGGETGFSIDLSGLQQGNTVTVKYTDGSGSHTVSFIAHDGSATVGDSDTADPNDTVVGIDLSGSSGSIADQIAGALPGLTVNDAGSDQVEILDDGPSGSIDVDSVTASITADGLKDGAAVPLFLDAGTGEAYTGLLGDTWRQPGFAARLVINPAVTADPANLVTYASDTQPSDATRPRAILDALTDERSYFSPSVGIGSSSAPFSGTVEDFMKQVVSTQGANAEQARTEAAGQDVVTANLEARYDDGRKVDIDTELADLIRLQSAYQANARVMTVAKEMLQALMDVMR